jgi:hypothetical protein
MGIQYVQQQQQQQQSGITIRRSGSPQNRHAGLLTIEAVQFIGSTGIYAECRICSEDAIFCQGTSGTRKNFGFSYLSLSVLF